MKALTICQPYAHLIVVGEKRVENRTWPTRYRGPLLIHAGKSRDWLEFDDDGREVWGYEPNSMAFGGIVAVARLDACVRYDEIRPGDPLAWVLDHQHAGGPWCWVLQDAEPLAEPIPWRGAQGIWSYTGPSPYNAN